MPDVLAEAVVVIGGQLAGDLAEGLVEQFNEIDTSSEETIRALEKVQQVADKAGAVIAKGFDSAAAGADRASQFVGGIGDKVVGATDKLADLGVISDSTADSIATGFDVLQGAFDLASAGADLASAGVKAYAAGLTELPAVQKTVALAQKALNLVMKANPIGLVITAITLLVAGLVLAYKKSETFRNIVNAAFNGVKKAAQAVFGFITGYIRTQIQIWSAVFNGFKKVLSSVWDGLVAAGKLAFQGLLVVLRPIVRIINAMIRGFNKVSALGGVPAIPQIPKFERGVRGFGGGLALVGEAGPEVVRLPTGSDVFSNRESQGLVGNSNTFVFNGPTSLAAARREGDWANKYGTRFGSATRAAAQ